jgi:tetratricopeptide (TPR) repeat protein
VQQWERYEEAIEDYRKAIAHNYHSIHKAYVSIGWCYEKLLKFEQAIAEYNHALAVNPKYSIALEHRSHIEIYHLLTPCRAGAKCRLDSKAAEEDCRLAIQINPRNLSFSYRYLAAVVADNNDYTQAIKMLSGNLQLKYVTNKRQMD